MNVQRYVIYLLMPIMAGLLVSAQALWGTVIKSGALHGTLSQIILTLLSSWRMWLGAMIYIAATLVYFVLLSNLKFFSVQIPMTALSIIFSVILSILLFREVPSILNIIGIVVVFFGILLVLSK